MFQQADSCIVSFTHCLIRKVSQADSLNNHKCITDFTIAVFALFPFVVLSTLYHHQHWTSVVSHDWANELAFRLQLASLALSYVRSCPSSICPRRLSTAWSISLVVFSYRRLKAINPMYRLTNATYNKCTDDLPL